MVICWLKYFSVAPMWRRHILVREYLQKRAKIPLARFCLFWGTGIAKQEITEPEAPNLRRSQMFKFNSEAGPIGWMQCGTGQQSTFQRIGSVMKRSFDVSRDQDGKHRPRRRLPVFKVAIVALMTTLMFVAATAASQSKISSVLVVLPSKPVEVPLVCFGTQYIQAILENAENLYLGISARPRGESDFTKWWNPAPIRITSRGAEQVSQAGAGARTQFPCSLLNGADRRGSTWTIQLVTSSAILAGDVIEIKFALWQTLLTKRQRPDSQWCQEYGVCLDGLVYETPWITLRPPLNNAVIWQDK